MKKPDDAPEARGALKRAARAVAGAVRQLFARQPRIRNESVEQGLWGEEVAARELEKRGYSVTGRRVRPSLRDKRLEIDIIARDGAGSTVFVEVKTHKRHSEYESAMPGINRAKKSNLRKACLAWLRRTGYRGGYRFAVVEVFGSRESGAPPEVRFYPDVPLFPPRWRFR